MTHCPSHDWDRYCDGLDEEAEFERQWWIRHADHVLQVVLARSTALATNHTKQIVEFAAAVVHEIYDRTVDPATGEEETFPACPEAMPENEKTPLEQADRAALVEIQRLAWEASMTPHNNPLVRKIYDLCKYRGIELDLKTKMDVRAKMDRPSSSP